VSSQPRRQLSSLDVPQIDVAVLGAGGCEGASLEQENNERVRVRVS